MAIAFGTAGASASGTASLSVPYPASIVAGDLLILVIANKYPINGPTTPAGFALPSGGQQSGASGANGIDVGSVYCTVYAKTADGTEVGNLAVTITAGNSAIGRMFRYTKTSTAVWEAVATNGSDNTAGTGWSVGAQSNPGIRTGDVVVVGSAFNTDNYTYSGQALTATGCTFGAAVERDDSGTNSGQNCGMCVTEHPCTAGTAISSPTYTATASGSAANKPAGASVFLRLRELGPVSATNAATASQTGALTGAGALAGATAAVAAEAGALAGAGELAGTAAATAAATAGMNGTLPISGTSASTAGQSGVLVGEGILTGAAAAVAAQTASLAGVGELFGTSAASAGEAGELLGAGVLSGTVTGAANQAAVVAGAGALVGTITEIAAISSALASAFGMLVGIGPTPPEVCGGARVAVLLAPVPRVTALMNLSPGIPVPVQDTSQWWLPMKAVFEAWWQDYGTMALQLDVRRDTTSPAIDFTAANAALVRLWTRTTDLGVFSATILATPTPTSRRVSIQYVPPPGQLVAGQQYYAAGLLSLDNGATWYPTRAGNVDVTPPS